MAGYYYTRLSGDVHDDLYAKALVLEKDGQRAALVACDLVTLPREVVDMARQQIERATRIPGDHVMISATHSHTGPVVASTVRDQRFGAGLPASQEYRTALPKLIAESVRQAMAGLTPATVAAAEGRNEELPFNRRFLMKDGTVGWNPGKQNPNIDKPAGPVDPTVATLLFTAKSGEPLAAYVNFPLHLDTVGGTAISADYPYPLSQALAKEKGPRLLTFFTIGTAGDINHINVSSATPQKGPQEAERIGNSLAATVKEAWRHMRPVPDGPLQVRRVMVPLPLAPVTQEQVEQAKAIAARIGTKEEPKFLESVQAFKALDVAERQGRPLEVEVQVISLGNELAWVSLPGEIFVELGLAIKKNSPFPHTIIAELANGSIGYIPTKRAYAQGNYEVISARCAEGSGEQLVSAAVRLLGELKSDAPFFSGKRRYGVPVTLTRADFDTYLQRTGRNEDPEHVFTVKDGVFRASGADYGYLISKKEYDNYYLTADFQWGEGTHPPRQGLARDSGLLFHVVGPDQVWPKSIEFQFIEGGTGDILPVGGATITVGGTRWEKGRADRYGKGPWQDVAGYRDPVREVEKPRGEWNHIELWAEGDRVEYRVNGRLVNEGYGANPARGRIVFQSEGAEVFFRNITLRPILR